MSTGTSTSPAAEEVPPGRPGTSDEPAGDEEPKQPLLGVPGTLALVGVGVALVVGFGIWVAFQAATDAMLDAEWARTVTVWDGIIAFASYVIGALLGVAVTIPRVADAKKKADEARDDKKTAENAAADKESSLKAKDADLKRSTQDLVATNQEMRKVIDDGSSDRVLAQLGRSLAAQVHEEIEREAESPSEYYSIGVSPKLRLRSDDPDTRRYADAPQDPADQEIIQRVLSQPFNVPVPLARLRTTADQILSEHQGRSQSAR